MLLAIIIKTRYISWDAVSLTSLELMDSTTRQACMLSRKVQELGTLEKYSVTLAHLNGV